jgi:hypothetical protein
MAKMDGWDLVNERGEPGPGPDLSPPVEVVRQTHLQMFVSANPHTTKYDDGQIDIEIRDGDQIVKDVIRVKLAILPENPAIGEKSREFNIRTQGSRRCSGSPQRRGR